MSFKIDNVLTVWGWFVRIPATRAGKTLDSNLQVGTPSESTPKTTFFTTHGQAARRCYDKLPTSRAGRQLLHTKSSTGHVKFTHAQRVKRRAVMPSIGVGRGLGGSVERQKRDAGVDAGLPSSSCCSRRTESSTLSIVPAVSFWWAMPVRVPV